MVRIKRINPQKGIPQEVQKTNMPVEKKVSEYSSLQERQRLMTVFFTFLQEDNQNFNAEAAFEELKKYILTYKRILYSIVSNIVYDITDDDNSGKPGSNPDRFGTLLSNIEKLVEYTDCDENIAKNITAASSSEEKTAIDETRKAVWKIWDHVNLAHRQYDVLRQSDAEFKRRFNEQIRDSQDSMTKEMNSQLLTMVGIFTALAFVLFGGISSLQSIFEGLQETHLLKLLILGCGWGLGMLNVVFVFLFCIGKMTKLNFKSTMSPDATFWQRYPVVCWTDFLLISLLSILSWLYYCINRSGAGWLDRLISVNPILVTIIGCFVFIAVISLGFFTLYRATKAKVGDEDE